MVGENERKHLLISPIDEVNTSGKTVIKIRKIKDGTVHLALLLPFFFCLEGGEKMQVKQGEVYRHFKGTFYYIVAIAQDCETLERLIVYQHLDDTKGIWTRKETSFFEEIPKRDDNVTGQKHRFERIDNLEEYHLGK